MNTSLLNRYESELHPFADFFRQLSRPSYTHTFSIPTEVSENEQAYELKLDLPGFQKENVDIDFKEGILTISAKRSEEKEEENAQKTLHFSERRYGEFKRAFALKNVGDEDIKAELKDGVLSISVPKRVSALSKKIAVS